MNRIVPLAVLAIALACGAPEQASPSSGSASTALSQGATHTTTQWVFGPGDFAPFFVDCLGETITFYAGTIDWTVLTTPLNGNYYTVNMKHVWNPPQWLSLTTGETWKLGHGYASVWNYRYSTTDLAQSNPIHEMFLEDVPMVNDLTGQEMTSHIKIDLLLDRNWNVKLDRFSWTFSCR